MVETATMGETAIIVALIAAAVSLTSLLLTTSLTESRERRRALWERELSRFLELEDTAGILVENVLSYKASSDKTRANIQGKMEFLHRASGRFLRYSDVAASLRDLHHAIGWFVSRKDTFDNSAEYTQARNDIVEAFRKLLNTSDNALASAHKRLRLWPRWLGR